MSSNPNCPSCGGELHPNARSCPHCGSTKEGDWDNSRYDEDEYDYEDFVNREFGDGPKPAGIPTLFWWIAGILLLIAFALSVLGLW